jgi:ClpP class serine protease
MRDFPHIYATVFNEPWMIVPDKMAAIKEVIRSAMAETNLAAAENYKSDKPQLQIISGIPIIPIMGVISKRMGMFTRFSGGTSIETLDAQFTEALNSDAKAIIFHVDSPGGAANGTPEFANRVYDAAQNSDKVICALIDGVGASAAYYIASQCNEIYCTESSAVGSIGTVANVPDTSRQARNEGDDSIVVRSSELKAVGNGPITARQIDSIQQRVDYMTEMFVSAVKRSRPGVDLVSFDPGSVLIGQQAVDRNLVDGLSSLDALLKKFSN